MFNELKEYDLVNEVGGRFRLTTLLQKRLVALNQGSRPLVETQEGEPLLAMVLREVQGGKIFLDEGGQLQTVEEEAAEEAEQ